MADLKQRYEVIDRLGLGDGTFLANLADEMPPFVLFGLHEIFQRMPGWQDIPLDLADVFDEIGDPDAFAVDSGIAFGVTAGTRARAAAVSAQAATEPETATDKFCTKLAKRTVDQVKVNRMKAFVFLLKSVFDAASEYPPEDANLSLIGEGAGSLKIPLKPFLVTVKVTIEVIQNFVETWRANVGVCRAIEVDLAGCTKLAEYRTSPAGNDKAYFLVKAVITGLDDQGVDVAVAKELLKKAENARDNSNWHKSFDRLCEAYAEL
jgi:hypothetical protein